MQSGEKVSKNNFSLLEPNNKLDIVNNTSSATGCFL